MNNHKILSTSRTTSKDIECVLLGRLGFSYRLISMRTGLSIKQITLRLKQTKSYVRTYRNGESQLAVRIADLSSLESKELINSIRKQIKDKL